MSETDERPVTDDWLTDVLRAGGVLPHGSVEAVDVVSSHVLHHAVPRAPRIDVVARSRRHGSLLRSRMSPPWPKRPIDETPKPTTGAPSRRTSVTTAVVSRPSEGLFGFA